MGADAVRDLLVAQRGQVIWQRRQQYLPGVRTQVRLQVPEKRIGGREHQSVALAAGDTLVEQRRDFAGETVALPLARIGARCVGCPGGAAAQGVSGAVGPQRDALLPARRMHEIDALHIGWRVSRLHQNSCTGGICHHQPVRHALPSACALATIHLSLAASTPDIRPI